MKEVIEPNIHSTFGGILGFVKCYKYKIITAEKALENIEELANKYESAWQEYMKVYEKTKEEK